MKTKLIAVLVIAASSAAQAGECRWVKTIAACCMDQT